MSDTIKFEISIPTDKDGYVLLQCPNCGTFFKMTPEDFQSDGILAIHCPSCGLEGGNYFTQDVLDLALAKAKNWAQKYINDELKKIEKKADGMVSISVESKLEKEYESPIVSTIDAMEIVSFPCCRKTIKIHPLLKMTGAYCPFCGVINYDFD